MLDPKRYYQNTDLHLAAYLVSTGKVSLLDIEWDSNNQAYFIFTDPPMCEQLSGEYYAHRALVDPFRFTSTLKELKSRLYANR